MSVMLSWRGILGTQLGKRARLQSRTQLNMNWSYVLDEPSPEQVAGFLQSLIATTFLEKSLRKSRVSMPVAPAKSSLVSIDLSAPIGSVGEVRSWAIRGSFQTLLRGEPDQTQKG